MAANLVHVRETRGAAAIGGLASPHQTVEELYLFTKVLRGLGTENIDHRPAQAVDTQGAGARWLGMPIAGLGHLDRILLVGATLRQEQPLVARRIRQAVKNQGQLNVIHAADDNLLCKVHGKLITAPAAWLNALAQVAKALSDAGAQVEDAAAAMEGVSASERARAIADSLMSGERKAVLLGALAQNHPDADRIHALAQAIARACGATLGFLSVAANSVGAQLAGARPGPDGLNAAAMLAQPRSAIVFMGVEPALDAFDAAAARDALKAAEFSVALTAFRSPALEDCNVLLPIAPFAETAGTFVNMEGRAQSFHGAVKPQGEARPAWKVLRVLGNLLSLHGFDYDSVESVRADALPGGQDGIAAHLDNAIAGVVLGDLAAGTGLGRLGETPLYQLDPLTRRAPALQAAAGADGEACANGSLLARLGLEAGVRVRVRQGDAVVEMILRRDDRLADGVVRVPAGCPSTAALGGRIGPISVEKA